MEIHHIRKGKHCESSSVEQDESLKRSIDEMVRIAKSGGGNSYMNAEISDCEVSDTFCKSLGHTRTRWHFG